MNELSDELVNFIIETIDSVEQIEVLLLLREFSDRAWTALTVNEVIRSDVSSIARRLDNLVALGLVAKDPDGKYRFNASTSDYARLVAELATTYRERRTRVIEMIYSKPKRGLHSFSSAFVIKKEPRDG